MRIAGLGFRDEATLNSLLDALHLAGALDVHRIALPARRAGHRLADALRCRGYDVTWVTDASLAATPTPTRSAIALATYGTGSVAEAAALAVARTVGGPAATLLAPRIISTDRMATAAIAETGEPE